MVNGLAIKSLSDKKLTSLLERFRMRLAVLEITHVDEGPVVRGYLDMGKPETARKLAIRQIVETQEMHNLRLAIARLTDELKRRKALG